MGLSTGSLISLVLLGVLCWFAKPAQAFGAGNIASISIAEGVNWRHGDIEDALLGIYMARLAGGRKFNDLAVKRVYFGNWLRDYSQAIDVGALKYVDKKTIRVILWILGFMTFGYATGEFEVTEHRLGCYRPEEHIDNPKDYADNQDARQYDERLRGPVDEGVELGIDPETGMKNYIANESLGIETSASLLRRTLGRSIEIARSYAQSGDERELCEALRLLGTGLHCLEDFPAHSNYTELAIRELGEFSIFPHVGEQAPFDLKGHYVFPLVTGTFGGVDFLHSVLGEASDKMVQSEVQQLEDTIDSSAQQADQDGGEGSILRRLLDKIPDGLLGGGEDFKSEAQQLEEKSNAKKEGGAGDVYGEELATQIYPVLEFHDKIMKAIAEVIDNIPGLSTLLEKLRETVSIFVFSLLAPYIIPILRQVKGELSVASEEVITSSRDKQHIVFDDPYSTDPTHSMLSKDHFSNQLNAPAGRVASAIVKYTVPLIMNAWDDESVHIDQLMAHIIQLFHHPALRDEFSHPGRGVMFEAVRSWWQDEKSEEEREYLRDALSREGVREGRNHKEGVHDSGHGCGKPISQNVKTHHSADFNLGEDLGAAAGQAVGEAVGQAFGGGAVGGFMGAALGKQLQEGGFGGFGGYFSKSPHDALPQVEEDKKKAEESKVIVDKGSHKGFTSPPAVKGGKLGEGNSQYYHLPSPPQHQQYSTSTAGVTKVNVYGGGSGEKSEGVYSYYNPSPSVKEKNQHKTNLALPSSASQTTTSHHHHHHHHDTTKSMPGAFGESASYFFPTATSGHVEVVDDLEREKLRKNEEKRLQKEREKRELEEALGSYGTGATWGSTDEELEAEEEERKKEEKRKRKEKERREKGGEKGREKEKGGKKKGGSGDEKSDKGSGKESGGERRKKKSGEKKKKGRRGSRSGSGSE